MRTVNIVGMGPSAASFNAENMAGEVWGLNYAYLFAPYLDRLFMLHRWEDFMRCAHKPTRRSKYFLEEIQNNIGEIWTYRKLQVAVANKDLPIVPGRDVDMAYQEDGELEWNSEEEKAQYTMLIDSKTVDANAMVTQFGNSYFTCTLPYVIGQAVIEGVSCINLFGIDLWDFRGTTEYGAQAPCVNAWIQWAISRGVTITIPWLNMVKASDRIFKKWEQQTDL